MLSFPNVYKFINDSVHRGRCHHWSEHNSSTLWCQCQPTRPMSQTNQTTSSAVSMSFAPPAVRSSNCCASMICAEQTARCSSQATFLVTMVTCLLTSINMSLLSKYSFTADLLPTVIFFLDVLFYLEKLTPSNPPSTSSLLICCIFINATAII